MDHSYIPPEHVDSTFHQISLCRTSVQNELSGEYILPDYIGDVKRILHTYARPKHTECSMEGRKVTYSGETVFTVLLQTNDGKTASTVLSLEYNGSCDCEPYEGDASAYAHPTCESVSARLLSPRKICINAKMKNMISVWGSEPIAPMIEGTHESGDEAALEERFDTVQSARVFRTERDGITLSEDMVLDGSDAVIGEILYLGAELALPDCRAGGGRISSSGNAVVTAICTDPDGHPFSVSRHFDITDSAECEFPDGCSIWAFPSVESIKASVSPNSYGENKVIELDMVWAYAAEGAYNGDTRLLRDAYSTDYVCENVYAPVTVSKLCRCDRLHFSVNHSRPREDLGAQNVRKIICTTVCLQTGSFSPNASGNLQYSSNADMTMIAECEDGEIRNLHDTFPVTFDTDMKVTGGSWDIRASAENVRGRLDSSAVYCDFEAVLCLTVMEKQNESCLMEIRFDRDNPLCETDRPFMTLYYPHDGEQIWDIARKYHTTCEQICTANHITSDAVHGEKVLLIPQNRRKSLFSGVI